MDEPAPRRLCPDEALLDKGDAFVFDVRHQGQPTTAFVLRFEGRLVGYLNRCAHVAAEMDWLPGQFLDSEQAFILCSIHGASYDPRNGRCAGGPCGRGSLTPIKVGSIDGQVHWYPSRDTRSPSAEPRSAAESST